MLVDDDAERVTFPPSVQHLAESIANELLHNQAAKKIIPDETVTKLRQGDPEFRSHGAREIGERVGAEQVVWVQVQDYVVSEQIQDALAAAQCTVSVKVINVLETKDRLHVRLYPSSPEGRLLSASLSGSEIVPLKTRDAISRELMRRLGIAVAKLFYEHRLGDFEKPS